MKKRASRTLFVVLASALVTAAFAAASASAEPALPYFSHIEYEGKDHSTPITGESHGSVEFQWVGGGVTCRVNSLKGEIVNPKELAKVFLKFSEGDCNGIDFCKQGSHETYWETTELKGRIAYLNKKEKTVGLLLEPVKQPFAKCNVPIYIGFETIPGSIIGQIEQEGATGSHFLLAYSQTNSEQGLTKFEGEEVIHRLEGVHKSGEKATKIGLGLAEYKLTAASEKGGVWLEK